MLQNIYDLSSIFRKILFFMYAAAEISKNYSRYWQLFFKIHLMNDLICLLSRPTYEKYKLKILRFCLYQAEKYC